MKTYETVHVEILNPAYQDILTSSEGTGVLRIGDCGEGVTLTWND